VRTRELLGHVEDAQKAHECTRKCEIMTNRSRWRSKEARKRSSAGEKTTNKMLRTPYRALVIRDERSFRGFLRSHRKGKKFELNNKGWEKYWRKEKEAYPSDRRMAIATQQDGNRRFEKSVVGKEGW